VPAYVVVEVTVSDPELYETYKPLAETSIKAHGGAFRARGGATESIEGAPPAERVVILEFPDLATAKGWYDSEEYQKALSIRVAASSASRLFFVDGYAP